MQVRLRKFLSILLCLISLCVVSIFRAVPSSRVLEGYRILFTQKTAFSERKVLDVLSESGVEFVISKSSQPSHFFDDYFSDRDVEYDLFYIADGQESSIEKAVAALSELSDGTVGIDGSGAFNILVPFSCLMFLVVLLVFSDLKFELLVYGGLLSVLVFSRPFHIVAVASSCSIFGFFLLLGFKRRYSMLALKLKFDVLNRDFRFASLIFITVLPAVLVLFSEPVSALFHLLILVASFSVFFNVGFVKLRSIKIFASRLFRKLCAFALVLSAFVLGCFFERFSSFESDIATVEVSDVNPFLPTPIDSDDSRDSKLPVIHDYVVSEWNRATAPYVPVSANFNDVKSSPEFGDFVSITEYSESNGRIVAEDKILFTFDDSFVESVCDSFSAIPSFFGNVLVSQSSSVFGYSNSASGNVAVKNVDFGILFVLLLMFILLGGYHIVLFLRSNVLKKYKR